MSETKPQDGVQWKAQGVLGEMASREQPQLPRPISRIFFRGFSDQAQMELLPRMPIHEGAMLSDELLQRALQVAKAFNEGLQILVSQGLRREEFPKLPQEIRNKVKPPASDDGVNVTIYDPASLPQRIRVEASVLESMSIEKITPVYPQELGEGESETGVVRLAVVVGKDGAVIDVNPLGGPELLTHAAADAVRQWRYRPTLLNGFPVEVQTNLEVSFTPNR